MPTLATSKFNEITENWLLLNVVWYILLSFATVLVMWYYSEKNLPWHIRISVFIALGASLSIVIMVPWDVSNVYHLRCQNTSYTEQIDGKEPTCPGDSTTITKVCPRRHSALCPSSSRLIFETGVPGTNLRVSPHILERCVLHYERAGLVSSAGAAGLQRRRPVHEVGTLLSGLERKRCGECSSR